MRLEERIKIDENALDVEWLEQSDLFLEVSIELADAKQAVDQAKLNADIVDAEMSLKIRRKPERYKIEKATEGNVHAAVLAQPSVRLARESVIHAQHTAAVIQAAVFAFDQRKRALENLVKLHGQQYFAGPSEPRDLHKERESYNTARRPKATKKRRKGRKV